MFRSVFCYLILIMLSFGGVLNGKTTADVDCRIEVIERIADRSVNVVSKVVNGNDGYLWFATWNGLHRYDGVNLVKIPPRSCSGDDVISERFNNAYVAPSGNLWCHVDNHLIVFDTKTMTFADITSDIETALNRQAKMERLYKLDTGDFMMELSNDGGWIIINEKEGAAKARHHSSRPNVRMASPGNLPSDVRNLAGINDVAFSGKTDAGECIISRDGDIHVRTNPLQPFKSVGHIPSIDGKRLQFSERDIDGNLWFTIGGTLAKVTMSPRPEEPRGIEGHVKATLRLSNGQFLIADSNGDRLVALNHDLTVAGYIGQNGDLATQPVSYGARIYSLAEWPKGTLWIGTKPDGLFRISDFMGQKIVVTRLIDNAAIYDILPDKHGNLWLATLDRGIIKIENSLSDTPNVKILQDFLPSYPSDAIRVRHIASSGDTLFAATTGGLLVLSAANPEEMTLLKPTSAVGSLPTVGISDVLVAGNKLFVATETGGVSYTSVDSLDAFARIGSTIGRVPDVTRSIGFDQETGQIIVVSESLIYTFLPQSPMSTLVKHPIPHSQYNFTESRPLKVDTTDWLAGHNHGAVVINLSPKRKQISPPLHFTSVTIHPRPDSLISSMTDTLTLKPTERTATLRFAAISFDNPSMVTYLFRFDDGPWTDLGNTTSITLLDLEPGIHSVEIESTLPDGTRAGNRRLMTLIVTPRFVETTLAKVLMTLLSILIVITIISVIIYIRRIKKRQLQTLEAYLSLVNAHTFEISTTEPQSVAESPSAPPPLTSPRDRQFMETLVKWIDENMADSDIDVDRMAAAVAMSRSALTRRMKSIINVTPAEFLKQSRLRRAASLLTTTQQPIKVIADDCGFSDINYFGKCFKSAYGSTPAAYRSNN